jgi:hypothetical protein
LPSITNAADASCPNAPDKPKTIILTLYKKLFVCLQL